MALGFDRAAGTLKVACRDGSSVDLPRAAITTARVDRRASTTQSAGAAISWLYFVQLVARRSSAEPGSI